jgi:hypothetical protein
MDWIAYVINWLAAHDMGILVIGLLTLSQALWFTATPAKRKAV